MKKTTKLITCLTSSVVMGVSLTQGATIVTPTNEVGDGIVNYTPTYSISNTDLLHGLAGAAVVSSGNFTLEISGGVPVLNDGLFQDITTGVAGVNHDAFGTAGNGGGSGTSVTYTLDTSVNILGYDISQIDVFGGWNDSGRDQQNYTVAVASVANPGVFVDITTVDFNPAIATGIQSATRTSITDDGAASLATGIGEVRFTFLAVENGYTGYAELDVLGTATTVPEPSSTALLGLTGMVLILRRRK